MAALRAHAGPAMRPLHFFARGSHHANNICEITLWPADHRAQLRVVAWSPCCAARFGLCNVFPIKRPNWRAICPNLKPNPKQDNLCEELARTAQSSPERRLTTKMAFRPHRKSWRIRLVPGWCLCLNWEGEAPAEPAVSARQEPRPPKFAHRGRGMVAA